MAPMVDGGRAGEPDDPHPWPVDDLARRLLAARVQEVTMSLALLFAASALAETPDVAHIWARQAVAAALFPQGLISDTRVQYRIPLHRSESDLFQDTVAGFGARVAATPAFTAVGPRITMSPIAVFDLDLQASWIAYYGVGTGLLRFSETEGKLDRERSARADDSVTGGAFQLSAAPTLKGKVGPVIAFYATQLAYTTITPGQEPAAPLTYEPFTDLVVEWQDVTFDHQGAVVLEVIPDDDGPFLWVGGTVRDRMALGSGDRSTAAGFLIRGRPGKGPWPTLLNQTLFYLQDADRVGSAPSVALLAEWKLAQSLR
jgi:hypothetical protein